jgi:hypothetical protein
VPPPRNRRAGIMPGMIPGLSPGLNQEHKKLASGVSCDFPKTLDFLERQAPPRRENGSIESGNSHRIPDFIKKRKSATVDVEAELENKVRGVLKNLLKLGEENRFTLEMPFEFMRVLLLTSLDYFKSFHTIEDILKTMQNFGDSTEFPQVNF